MPSWWIVFLNTREHAKLHKTTCLLDPYPSWLVESCGEKLALPIKEGCVLKEAAIKPVSSLDSGNPRNLSVVSNFPFIGEQHNCSIALSNVDYGNLSIHSK